MNSLKNFVVSLALIAAASLPFAAQAQTQSPVTLSGDVKAVQNTVDAEGNETVELVEPNVIVPGDRLMFITGYANSGAEAVDNFVVTNPLPAAVRLAGDADAALTVSVDGGTTWGTLDTLSVTDENGEPRAATHADVTHVRWTLASIAPGESGQLEYPAIIR